MVVRLGSWDFVAQGIIIVPALSFALVPIHPTHLGQQGRDGF